MKRKPVVQTHHISYQPEVTVVVYKGEHMILTHLGWRKRVSEGFVIALRDWLHENEAKAVKLKAGGPSKK